MNVLWKTKKVLEERGWCKYHFENTVSGKVCLRGAYRIAAGEEPGVINSPAERSPAGLAAAQAMKEAIRELFPLTYDRLGGSSDPWILIATWNNDPWVSLDDVLAVVRLAAEKLVPEPLLV